MERVILALISGENCKRACQRQQSESTRRNSEEATTDVFQEFRYFIVLYCLCESVSPTNINICYGISTRVACMYVKCILNLSFIFYLTDITVITWYYLLKRVIVYNDPQTVQFGCEQRRHLFNVFY